VGPAGRAKDKEARSVTYPTPMYELEAGPNLDRMGRGPEVSRVIMASTRPSSTRSAEQAQGPVTTACRRRPSGIRLPRRHHTGLRLRQHPRSSRRVRLVLRHSPNKEKPRRAYHKVMAKKPNPWGLYDMHGNVSEYVIDKYDAAGTSSSPQEPELEGHHRLAGQASTAHDACGSWNDEAEGCRSAARPRSRKGKRQGPQLPRSPHG